MARHTSPRRRQPKKSHADHSSEDDIPLALDEEEQETLVRTLKEKNTTSNKRYTAVLLTLTLCLTIPYLYLLFTFSSAITPMTALLALTSLASTAYILAYLPLPAPSAAEGSDATLGISSSVMSAKSSSPVEKYLVQLDGVLAVLLAMMALKSSYDLGKVVDTHTRTEVEWGTWLGVVPGVMLGLVQLGRREMAGLEGEVEKLSAMRYDLKGA